MGPPIPKLWWRCVASLGNEDFSKKSGVEIEAKFHTIDHPVNIRGEGWRRMLSGSFEYTLLSNLWYTFDGRPLRGVEV